MKKHRVFIAVSPPQKLKKRLSMIENDYSNLPVFWTRPENLHITLLFLGYLTDQEMSEVCRLTRQVVSGRDSFEVSFNKIEPGPIERSPRMIWLTGEKSVPLAELKYDLENSLVDEKGSAYGMRENKAFRPHITLARVNQSERRVVGERPDISREFKFNFQVESVEVMESHLQRGGAQYVVLESIPLR